MIELILSMFLLAVAFVGLVGVLDVSRDLTNVSERRQAAAAVGEQEMERILAMEYDEIALAAAPGTSTDPNDPRHHVAGSGTTYRWNQTTGAPAPHTEPLVVAAGGAVNHLPSTWNDGRLSGTIHRFVTWRDEASCSLLVVDLCPGTEDYKRITVAVTIDGETGPDAPILLSSFSADPDAGPITGVTDALLNPLLEPSTECLDGGGDLIECAANIGTNALTLFLYDTNATTSSSRQTITGNHSTHPTIAPIAGLLCTLIITAGCPDPDLMGTDPPPDTAAGQASPTLFNYSTDVAGSILGGRILRRDSSCSGTPSTADNTRGGFWVSNPFGSNTVLNGQGGFSLVTQTVGGVAANAQLCVAFYDVSNSLLNLIGSPPSEIARVSYSLSEWPQSAEPVAFTFDFLSGSNTVTIPSGHRIGVRVWASGSSGADIAAVYDHPLHPSAVQFNVVG